jgi:hypothetical protein
MDSKVKYYLETLHEDGKYKSDKFLPYLHELTTVSGELYILVRDPSTGEIKQQHVNELSLKFFTSQGQWVQYSNYNPGDYVLYPSTDDPTVDSMWIFTGSEQYFSEYSPDTDTSYWIEFKAPKGERPQHEWSGPELRFQNADGTWGEWINLQGDVPEHEWDETSIRFKMPDGEWGEWVDLQGESFNSHERLHDMDSEEDHAPASEEDWGALVEASSIDGKIQFTKIIEGGVFP